MDKRENYKREKNSSKECILHMNLMVILWHQGECKVSILIDFKRRYDRWMGYEKRN